MSVKIQINSLEALERLLGGDSQVEIEMRQAIAVEFTKKHLKALATADLVAEAKTQIMTAIKAVRAEIRDQIQDHLSGEVASVRIGFRGEIESCSLHQRVKDELTSLARQSTRDVVAETIEKMRPDLEKIAADVVTKHIKFRLDEAVNTEVRRRMEFALKGGK